MARVIGLVVLAGLAGCDRTGDQFRNKVTDVPHIKDLGTLTPITEDEWGSGWDPAEHTDKVVYEQLGAPEDPGVDGGATFQFVGNGHNLCIVADPEAIFWNQSVSFGIDASKYRYQDFFTDDGDLDMYGGLTAYYNGSPGVEIGDFIATYTDAQGIDHALPFDECLKDSPYATEVHSGQAWVEACTISTDAREGVLFTVLLRTFSLPMDDSILNFAVGVFDVGDGTCSDVFTEMDNVYGGGDASKECLFTNEVGLAGTASGDDADKAESFVPLEQAFCAGIPALNSYCQDNMNSDAPPCDEPVEAPTQ